MPDAPRDPTRPDPVAVPTLAGIRSVLGGREPPPGDPVREGCGEAAVAAVFAPLDGGAPALLLIKRAPRADDPWSGQIALPGGRRESGDVDPVATARRETLEEVGVELPAGCLVGRLRPVPARIRSVDVDLRVHPAVFVLDEAALLHPSSEVEDSRWVPLRELLDPDHACTYKRPASPAPRAHPAVRLGPWVLWGLTWRILADLFRTLGHRLPGSP